MSPGKTSNGSVSRPATDIQSIQFHRGTVPDVHAERPDQHHREHCHRRSALCLLTNSFRCSGSRSPQNALKLSEGPELQGGKESGHTSDDSSDNNQRSKSRASTHDQPDLGSSFRHAWTSLNRHWVRGFILLLVSLFYLLVSIEMYGFVAFLGASTASSSTGGTTSAAAKRSTSSSTPTTDALNTGLVNMASSLGMSPGGMTIVFLNLFHIIGLSVLIYLASSIFSAPADNTEDADANKSKSQDSEGNSSSSWKPTFRVILKDIPLAVITYVPVKQITKALIKSRLFGWARMLTFCGVVVMLVLVGRQLQSMVVILQRLQASEVMIWGDAPDIQASLTLYTAVLESLGDSAGLYVVLISNLGWMTFGVVFFYALFRLLESPTHVEDVEAQTAGTTGGGSKKIQFLLFVGTFVCWLIGLFSIEARIKSGQSGGAILAMSVILHSVCVPILLYSGIQLWEGLKEWITGRKRNASDEEV